MTDDSDARYLITNAVMPRLENLDKGIDKIFDRIDRVCTTQTDLMITDEMMKAKIASIEMMNVNTQKDIQEVKALLLEHKRDGVTHYNSHYNESIPQKLWRKKPEIAAGGGLGALLYLIILFLIENFGG